MLEESLTYNYMLNVTVNKTNGVCTSLTYEVDTEENFTYTDLVLEVTVDCCCTKYTKTIYENGLFALNSTGFTVDAAGLGVASLTNGVYSSKIIATNSSTGSYRTETSCDFVDCDLQCKIFEALDVNDADKTLEILNYYYALQLTSTCEPCDCEDACAMWNVIKENLNINCSTCGG